MKVSTQTSSGVKKDANKYELLSLSEGWGHFPSTWKDEDIAFMSEPIKLSV